MPELELDGDFGLLLYITTLYKLHRLFGVKWKLRRMYEQKEVVVD
jgi:hypothetical protein